MLMDSVSEWCNSAIPEMGRSQDIGVTKVLTTSAAANVCVIVCVVAEWLSLLAGNKSRTTYLHF